MTEFSREHPFLAPLIDRRRLSPVKDTLHLALDLTGSNITYEVGDCIGVYPINPKELVDKTLEAAGFTGHEEIINKKSHEKTTLFDYLTYKASITSFSRKLLSDVAGEVANPKEMQETHEVWDLLKAYKNPYDAQTFADRLMPLLPRLYSISSSLKAHPNEVHLTIHHLVYETRGHTRKGVCTHFLSEIAPIGEKIVPIYPYPHKGFTIPKDPNTPIIMVGPGTGVAPFRAFLEERRLQNASQNWLFFGEWRKASEYFYEEEFKKLEAEGFLRIDTAFSRDQAEKIYVQHRLLEKGEEVMEWLEKGAVFYVCGDMHHMAKDVDKALHDIIEKFSSFNPQEYVKNLRHSNRYLKDVY